jgi:ribosomal-protein-alanine N-acetyltransferase
MLYITTQRLILKPHTPANLAWFHTLINDEDEKYYDGDDPPTPGPEPIEKAQTMFDRILNRSPDSGIIDYAIHKKDGDVLIGCGDIAHIDSYNQRCDLGITMGYDKKNWGKGYASEALRAVLAFCFNELSMNRVGAEVYEFNLRSIRLFEGLGFTKEGAKRQFILKDGNFKDELIYSLLKKDWEKLTN